jgi:hypothetical protein
MDRQQNAPVLTPFFEGEPKRISDIWQSWFQRLKTRDDEVRRRPYKTYTTDQTLTTWELGRSVLFSIGTSAAICTLPSVGLKDVWSWITIVRIGTGNFKIYAPDDDYIEKSGKAIGCKEPNRIAANVTLQLVTETQWAIIGATGIWSVKPY